MIMATRNRHSPEQVVRKLTPADRLLAEGKDVAAVCARWESRSRPTVCASGRRTVRRPRVNRRDVSSPVREQNAITQKRHAGLGLSARSPLLKALKSANLAHLNHVGHAHRSWLGEVAGDVEHAAGDRGAHRAERELKFGGDLGLGTAMPVDQSQRGALDMV